MAAAWGRSPVPHASGDTVSGSPAACHKDAPLPASRTELASGRFGPVVHGGRRRRPGKLDVRRIAVAVVAMVAVLALSAVGTAGALLVVSQRSMERIDLGNVGDHDADGDPQQAVGSDGGTVVDFDEVTEPTTILVVGTDSRSNLSEEQLLALGTEDDGGTNLTDTIMLVQVDPARDAAALLSFPRDLYIRRCNGTKGKINAAYAIGEAIEEGGGPECLVDTIEDATGIPVDHYVQVDLAGFINAVDAIGGVTFHVQEPLRDVAAGLDIDAGCVTFDGARALAFVRARKIDNDFGRIARQQRFLREMIDKVTSAGVLLNPVRLFSLVNEVGASLTTDSGFGLAQQRDLAFSLRNLDPEALATRTVPGDIAMVDGASVVIPDEERAERLFEAFRDGRLIPEQPQSTPPAQAPSEEPPALPPEEVEPLVVLNGAGTTGLASQTSALLESAGYTVASTADADRFGIARTRVEYPPGARTDAESVASALAGIGVEARLVNGDAGDDLTIVLGEDLDPEALATAMPDQPGVQDTATPLPPAETPDFSGAQVSGRSC